MHMLRSPLAYAHRLLISDAAGPHMCGYTSVAFSVYCEHHVQLYVQTGDCCRRRCCTSRLLDGSVIHVRFDLDRNHKLHLKYRSCKPVLSVALVCCVEKAYLLEYTCKFKRGLAMWMLI